MEKKTAAFLAEAAARRFSEGSVLLRQLISSERAATATPSTTVGMTIVRGPQAGK